jgi:hypothetical protein
MLTKVNDIWLPTDLQSELFTEDIKLWVYYCKMQKKDFDNVVDAVGEYGIWSRSMRFYAKNIRSFQNVKHFVEAWQKNCERYNNINYYQQEFTFDMLPDKIDVLRINGDMLENVLNLDKDIQFIFVDNFKPVPLHGYKKLFAGKRDQVLYICR